MRTGATIRRDGPRARPRATHPLALNRERPAVRVYGYLTYWRNELTAVPWAVLTDVALFSATATATGELADIERWGQLETAVALANRHGVRLHLCVTNFSSTDLATLLGQPENRGRLVSELVRWTQRTGAHGVNVDFEGEPQRNRQDVVTLAEELARAGVGDVVFAVPAVDHNGAWDLPRLAEHADLFLMAYDYHWNGSSHAGPVDPYRAGSGTIWWRVNRSSVSRSVDDVVDEGVPPERLILGLPLYGRHWPATGSIPSRANGSGEAILFDEAWSWADRNEVFWEPDAQAPYFQDGERQVWFGSTTSVQQRIRFARSAHGGLAGVGFWALLYTQDPAFWQTVGEETRGNPVAEPAGAGSCGGCHGGGTIWWGWWALTWLCFVRRVGRIGAPREFS